MTTPSFSRGQMVRDASLTKADLAEVAKCRRDHNRLGFAYQVGFVRLFNRFPAQQPLEVCDELLGFVAMQLNIDAANIEGYAVRQHTVSDHQARIRDYLELVVFDPEQAQALERFIFEESCSLQQTASLLARAREFLKQWRVLSLPNRRCCGWSGNRGSGPANTSLAGWPGASRPAGRRPSTACRR
jgi:hypothetical protein